MNQRPSDRVRVACVIDDLGFGGAQRQLALLAPALTRSDTGVEVSVFCLSGITEPFAKTLREQDVEVSSYKRRSSLDVARLVSLCRGVRGSGAGVIHSFLDASNTYAFMAATILRLPIIMSMLSDRLSMTGIRGRALVSMMRRADLIITNSEAGQDALVGRLGVDASRVRVIRNSMPDDVFVTPENDGAVVGFIGRLVPLKRVDVLIDAFAAIDMPSAKLIIVGDGPERDSLQDHARGAGVGDRVIFTGALEDVSPVMKRFSCLALPSKYEGLPNAVLEAMAAGIPVVVRPVGDLPGVVVDGRTGILVGDESTGALAASIARALTDEGLRRSARREGPRFIREQFSLQKNVARFAVEYRRLAGATQAR